MAALGLAGRGRGALLMFDRDRRVASISTSAQRWFALLDDDGANGVPVAVQAVVSELAGSAGASARLLALDRHGRRVAVRAERALHVAGGDATTGYSVSISGASIALGEPALTGAQWAVAREVARGLSDREVASALGISTATVHERVAALHRLLGTGTRVRLVAELASALREDA
jgi:DNA-binding NarL/FixJ family response regulator